MTYDTYKEQLTEYLKEHINEYLPEKYQGTEIVTFQKALTNGGVADGITFKVSGNSVSPAFYLNDEWGKLRQETKAADVPEYPAGLLDYSAGQIAESFVKHMEEVIKPSSPSSSDIIRMVNPDNLYLILINTEANREMLSDCPHREFLDLSIVYRIKIEGIPGSYSSMPVKNEYMPLLGMTENEMYHVAYKNTPKLFKFGYNSLQELLSDVPDEYKQELEEVPMLIASNSEGIYGASVILYPEILDSMANRFGSDLYIIPSSLHDVITVPQNGMDSETLMGFVHEVNGNSNVIDQKDVLSNRVYGYNIKEKELSIAVTSTVPSINKKHSYISVPRNTSFKFTDSGWQPDVKVPQESQGIANPVSNSHTMPKQPRGPKM